MNGQSNREPVRPSLETFAIDAPVQKDVRVMSLRHLREAEGNIRREVWSRPDLSITDDEWMMVAQIEAEIAIRESILGEFELAEQIGGGA